VVCIRRGTRERLAREYVSGYYWCFEDSIRASNAVEYRGIIAWWPQSHEEMMRQHQINIKDEEEGEGGTKVEKKGKKKK
jgi:hypothetical protein